MSERRPWFHIRAALDRGVAAGLSGDELADSIYVDLVDRGILPPWDHEGEQGVLIAVIDADGGETA